MTLLNKKATTIKLFDFKSPQMRAFHLSWFAFFLCFFGWFGIAPLMAVVREELDLTKSQIGNIIIASVAVTVLARLFIGWLVDRIGPRITYTYLLILGSLPVILIGLSDSYETFLLFRLAIGIIGASFVITQYHTSVMFAPNVVGTANATSAGWGNMGGGVTQMVMPIIFTLFISLGFLEGEAWRYAMMVPGIAMILTGIAYYHWTTDFPEGNIKDFSKKDLEYKRRKKADGKGALKSALSDRRVWALFLIYGACFGIELTINNIAAIYYHDFFQLDLKTAGLIAGLFGVMNLFARTLGGFFGDKAGIRWGLKGRVGFLGVVLLVEGIALILFSQMTLLSLAIGTMILFSLFVQMAEGATFSVVPFVNKKAIGMISGIVGAGGNVGAVMAGVLLKMEGISYSDALSILGITVAAISASSLLIRFSKVDEKVAQEELQASLDQKAALQPEMVNS
ncbi:NarK family nitrate/nitrite MFS transporter [Cyclobacterium sp. SYSU L10401]|uniref:NarK family nitrate/nitrite MFS transporter n=1 Tax=Cyclobacterium sp. SYSU L10401 TaxID=2678657 RepID=UPI001969C99E|nr:NarK family nitrate/nitrite MFS transporter [Cyclobacterium sp. SYSU L10401]